MPSADGAASVSAKVKGKGGKGKGPDLSALKPLYDATHLRDQSKCPPKVTCTPGTRRDVTKRLISWASSSDFSKETHICWLYGGSGEGKSTIAQDICVKLEKKKRLVGSFFWSRESGEEERGTWKSVAPTLGSQVAQAIPGTGEIIEQVLKDEPNLLQSYISLANQIDKLVYGPCKAVLCKKTLAKSIVNLTAQTPYVIVLDGIDACYDQDQLFDFVDRARKFFVENPKIPLRILICGRINAQFALQASTREISLIDLAQHSPKEDVAAYIRSSLAGGKHTEANVKAVEGIAKGSLAVAVPLVEYILEQPNAEAFPLDQPHLDKFYAHILARGSDLPHSSDILSAFTLLKSQLTVTGLAKFLGISTYEVLAYLTAVSPILLIPGKDDDIPLSFFHEGVRDFLLDETRSQAHHIDEYVLRSVVYRYLDLVIVHYEGLSEDRWMLPMEQTITQCILEWPIHLDLVREADPSFDVTGFDSRYTQILSRIQFLPLFPEVLAILGLMGANSLEGDVQVIHILTILQVPLSDIELILHGLAQLVAVGKGAANRTAGSITMSNRCSFRHPSIRDFLLDPQRSHGLSIAPAQYTFLSQRFMDIAFSVPVMMVNDRTFFVWWPKYLSMAIEKDAAYDLDGVEETFKLVPPSLRARIVATQAWQDALALVLESWELDALKANVGEAVEVIKRRVPTAFDGIEEGFYLDKGENVHGLTSPRLLGGLVSPPVKKKTSGLVIASKHPVTIVEMLEGFRLLLDFKGNSSRFCMPRGSGIGLQVERYPMMNTKTERFLLSLYQYNEPDHPERDSDSDSDEDGEGAGREPDIVEEDREMLIPVASGSGTKNH
ncbi:hypothetical protein NMY22_g11744 [Coprinellus aureogranulatus]|nr:hypothetical protein NMY22_g11744 [Coprinellus aureogranulatus]